VEPLDDATCAYRTGDDDLDWLAMRVLMLGVDFEVHEPPELAERLRSLARRIDRATAP
jgi:predicted DNA-binding transcriptional regulator YafY